MPGCRGGSALLGSRGNAHWRVEGSRPIGSRGEAPCPGKVDACVNFVLEYYLTQTFAGFAASPPFPPGPAASSQEGGKLFETDHDTTGASGKHGTYNPRHNDRRFDVEKQRTH